MANVERLDKFLSPKPKVFGSPCICLTEEKLVQQPEKVYKLISTINQNVKVSILTWIYKT